jgi:acyl-CoA synthetase (AMP-forming)/AMP-acid ligase II/acyl carrier protein
MERRTIQAKSIPETLSHHGQLTPQSVVLLAPGRTPLTWPGLRAQLENVLGVLRNQGLDRSSRVAVVLPDGPELAAAFLSISSCATFAPLNPAYREEEFDFYMTDLRAKALVVPANHPSPARAVARKHGIPILELRTVPGAPAGQFLLEPAQGRVEVPALKDWATPDDVALILHTSGTTSRPKIVPLTHRNLCNSAGHIATTLGLTSHDRGLCVMPLFHIHGLIGALMSSIWAGASVVCPPGFSATGFFAWLSEFKPTWYSAVPTMHQAILSQAPQHQEIIQASRLRLIRSSSSALPPTIMRRLEEVFAAPVIEAYGMTEASHQMASNPLPPKVRKPGSVGQAAGPEVAIMGEAGELLKPGERGEIVIRGPNVTAGYENNPAANAAAFLNGWFRTGDQGCLDPEGYLFITGRLKEIINRGGEKVAPREIDEVLLNYPGVRQAVAFGIAHPTLGEDIAAAVVTIEGQVLSEPELRGFAAQHLPPFKVPSRIIFLKEIPKGPTGKVQRIGLGERLAAELAVRYEAPASPLEEQIAQVCQEVLHRERVGRTDNFFFLGGDSLRATQVTARLSQGLGMNVAMPLLFQFPTPALLASELERRFSELDVATLAAELEKLPALEAARLLDSAGG